MRGEPCGAIPVGSRVKFPEEKQAYTVQASSERFAVCTKPFNPRKTVLYSVMDFQRKVRGTEDLIFGFGAETRKQCEEMLDRLVNGHSSVSYRNCIPLKIETISAASATPLHGESDISGDRAAVAQEKEQ